MTQRMTDLRDTSIITTGFTFHIVLEEINILISILIGLATLSFTVVRFMDYLKNRTKETKK